MAIRDRRIYRKFNRVATTIGHIGPRGDTVFESVLLPLLDTFDLGVIRYMTLYFRGYFLFLYFGIFFGGVKYGAIEYARSSAPHQRHPRATP